MSAGDHIRVFRPLIVFQNGVALGFWHHGIDVGNGFVVHYTGGAVEKLLYKYQSKVSLTTKKQFRGCGKILKARPPKGHKPFSREEVVDRAWEALNSQPPYNLVFNNCEHFANYISCGVKKSRQVRRASKWILRWVFKKLGRNPAFLKKKFNEEIFTIKVSKVMPSGFEKCLKARNLALFYTGPLSVLEHLVKSLSRKPAVQDLVLEAWFSQ